VTCEPSGRTVALSRPHLSIFTVADEAASPTVISRRAVLWRWKARTPAGSTVSFSLPSWS